MTEYEFDLDVIKYRQARGYNQCEICRDGDIDSLILKVDELTEKNMELKEANKEMSEELDLIDNAGDDE